MKLKSIALAAALVVTSASSFAATQTATFVAGSSTNFFSHVTGSFADELQFTIPAGSVSASAVSITLGSNTSIFDITGLTGTIWNNFHPQGTTNLGTFSGNNVTFNVGSLAAGNYHIDFTGTATGTAGGSYIAALSVTAVPEPETYAMLLAGLGLMGSIARRRNAKAA